MSMRYVRMEMKDPNFGLPGGYGMRHVYFVLDFLLTAISFFLQYPMQLIFAFMRWMSYRDHAYGAAHAC
jgi:hypothetical protein